MTAADRNTTADAPSDPYLVVLDELIVTEPDDGFSREDVARSIVEMLSAARLLRTPDTPDLMENLMGSIAAAKAANLADALERACQYGGVDDGCGCLHCDAARLLRTPDTPTDSEPPVGLHIDTERNPVGLTFTRDIGLPTDSGTAARARALLDAATPGPWHESCGAYAISSDGMFTIAECRETLQAIHNAELIAAAPTLITDLLADLDRVNEAVATEAWETLALSQVLAERDAAVAQADRLTAAIRTHEDLHRPVGPEGDADMDPWPCCDDDRLLWAAADREDTRD